VEFSLIMPVLFLAMTGILSFGMTMPRLSFAHEWRELRGAGSLDEPWGQTTTLAPRLFAAVQSASPSLVSANLTYAFSINGTAYSGTKLRVGAANMLQGVTAEE